MDERDTGKLTLEKLDQGRLDDRIGVGQREGNG